MAQFLRYNAFGIISLLVGTLVSYYFYRRSIRKKEVAGSHSTEALFSSGMAGELPKLEIFYGKKPITNIVRTRLGIWNSGDEIIEKSDLVPVSPFRVELNTIADPHPTELILDCRVHASTCSASA